MDQKDLFGAANLLCFFIPEMSIVMGESHKPDSMGKLKFPGGEPEKGESVLETLEREVREEAGIDIRTLDIFPTWTKPTEGKRGYTNQYFFFSFFPRGFTPTLRPSGIPWECGAPQLVPIASVFDHGTRVPKGHCVALAHTLKLLHERDCVESIEKEYGVEGRLTRLIAENWRWIEYGVGWNPSLL